MVKCERGKVEIIGLLIEIFPEFMCLAGGIAKAIKETESEEMITLFKSELSDAIAIGFGEKTLEECFTWDKDNVTEHGSN